jgi:uridine phosphorylase
LGSDLPLWHRAGVVAVEMEIATLYVVSALHGVESAAVVAIDGNPLEQDGGSMESYNPNQEAVREAVQSSIEIGLTALIS